MVVISSKTSRPTSVHIVQDAVSQRAQGFDPMFNSSQAIFLKFYSVAQNVAMWSPYGGFITISYTEKFLSVCKDFHL